MPISKGSLHDQIRLHSSPARLRVPAFQIINALQKTNRPGGEQMLAAAVALVAMCEATNFPLYDLIKKAVSISGDVEAPFTSHLQSVRDYANGELLKGGL